MTKLTNYNIRFRYERDVAHFTAAIAAACADALEQRGEKFSALRLRKVKINLTQEMLHGYLGLSHANGVLDVHAGLPALNLAEVVIHEHAHQLVGNDEYHNNNFRAGAQALGLRNPKSHAISQEAISEADFTEWMFEAIERALAELLADYPEWFIDPEGTDIPFPDGKMPMPFQIEGIRQMLKICAGGKNILLADEMGLGKTWQVMGFINATHPKSVLIVCPNSIKLSWRKHFMDLCVHEDLKEELEVAHTALYSGASNVVIMNYEALTRHVEMVKRKVWDFAAFDEFHYCKTPSAKRSRAAYSVKAATQVGVTGTPIVNYPYELFPLIHYLDRENWPEYGRFEAQFGSRGSNKLGRNLNRLNSMLRATIMIRRVKREVLKDLPRKRRIIEEFEVPDEVRPLIESEKNLWKEVEGANEQLAHWVNAMRSEATESDEEFDWQNIILQLQQTKRYAFEEMARIAHAIGRAKLPFVIEHIKDILENREKVIVFGHHRDVLSGIAKAFEKESVLLLGGNSDQSQATFNASEKFSNDENCRIFVGQVSIAQGYSLKGSSTVLFVEEDWVPGVMTQAEDRAHGIGRGDSEAKSMLIKHLVFEDSMDTVKAQQAIKKQKSIDRAVGTGHI